MRNLSIKMKSIIAICLVVVLVVAIAVPVALTRPGREFYLVSAPRTFLFHSADTTINLPAVGGLRENDSVGWSVVSGEDFVELSGDQKYFRIFPLVDRETANVRFRASVFNGNSLHSTFNYDITIRDPRTETLTRIFSPNQTGRAAYRTQGIANQRVFGLWDTRSRRDSPEGTTVYKSTASRFAHLMDSLSGYYVKSGSHIDLAWRYVGDVVLQVQLLDQNGVVLPSLDDSVMSVELNEENARVDVQFNGVGVRTVRVLGWSSEKVNRTIENAVTYQFTYDIRDAVNAFTIQDIKEVEFNARVSYIIDGVNYTGGVGYMFRNIIDDPRFNFADEDAAFNHFVPRPNEELNSDRFHRFSFRPIVQRMPREYSYTFEEFRRWAPSFRYQFGNIVIRDNIQTLPEGTWFFGDVFGNGFQLDATPYAENVLEHTLPHVNLTRARGANRNVFGTGWAGNGLERLPQREGSGWGSVYAFYMTSNGTIMCNIVLTGWDRRNPDGSPARLSEFNRLSVVGTPNMGGGVDYVRLAGSATHVAGMLDFQVGHTHNNGVFLAGRYVHGITFQNSIFEKGLTLVGVHHAPIYASPVRIDTSVLRYSGFTAIYGLGMYAADAAVNSNLEGGDQIAANNVRGSGIRTNGVRYGNHIAARNVTIYEITTVAMVFDNTDAGTFIRFYGEYNYFMTWLRMIDLAFPMFKMPAGHFYDGGWVPAITQIAQDLMNIAVSGSEHAIVREGQTFWVNIPVLAVSEGPNNNGWCFDFSNMSAITDSEAVVIGIAALGFVLHFEVQPADATDMVTQQRQQEIFNTPGELARVIRRKYINRVAPPTEQD